MVHVGFNIMAGETYTVVASGVKVVGAAVTVIARLLYSSKLRVVVEVVCPVSVRVTVVV